MSQIDITEVYDTLNPAAKIENKLQQDDNQLELIVPLPSVNVSNSYRDITEDHLAALYVAESLAKCSYDFSYSMDWDRHHYPVIVFTFRITNASEAALKITKLALLFVVDSENYDEEDRKKVWEELFSYEDKIDEQTFAFPELADDYYANLVNGVYLNEEEMAPGELKKIFRKYPERKHGFWKSALSEKLGFPIYVSPGSWIVANENMEKIHDFWQIESSRFIKCDLLSFNYEYILLSGSFIAVLPFNRLIQAAKCAVFFYKNRLGWQNDDDWIECLYTNPEVIEIREQISLKGWSSPVRRLSYFLSPDGDILVVRDDEFSYIIYSLKVMKQHEILSLREGLSKISGLISSIAGITDRLNFDWDKLDDEQFEQLCYDMIYYSPKFDNATIRKMGKSRSRDGGRDIVVMKRQHPGDLKKKKFIFQCKLVKTGQSLTTSKVTGISDVIDQYGADGYGILTNTVIDGTLYDRLDGISVNRNIEMDTKAIFEIERFLAANSEIANRYFDKSGI